jgi:uncharacterized protein (DUF934 family)
MPNEIIRHGAVIADDWQLLRQLPDSGLPAGKIIVPATYWLEQRDALRARGDVGVWLASDQAPQLIADDLATLPLVAIDFPVFTDGRGFSYGRTLREHYGYKGEVRAIGEFLRDQLYYLSRCGFDAYALTTSDIHAALAAFNDFSSGYQASVSQPQPRFKRN